jgi:hypothetical protein
MTIRKSLDYHEIARRGLIVNAYGNKIPIEIANPSYEREIDVSAFVLKTQNEEIGEIEEKDLHAALWAIWIISFTNLANSDEEIQEEIKSLEGMVDTGYYDDEAGNLLMKQVIVYLQGKLSKDK